MPPYALIKNATIANLVEWDGVTPYNPDGDLVLLSELPAGVSIGWTLVNGVWTPPEPIEE